MKNILEIGLKLFGLYFFYESAVSLIELYIQFVDNKMFGNNPIGLWILSGIFCKVFLYAILGWTIIFRNENVTSKLFHKTLISNENKLINIDLKRSDLIFILLKLGGFLLLTESIILIFSSVFPFIGIYQIAEKDDKVITGFLNQASYEILKLVIGIIIFTMTEKLMSWIKE